MRLIKGSLAGLVLAGILAMMPAVLHLLTVAITIILLRVLLEFASPPIQLGTNSRSASFRFSFVLRQSRSSVDRCFLRDSVLCNQHHAKPCFALDHASVSISSLFERNCLDHRANVLQDTKGKGVFVIDRRAGQ
jgi:hypothetical protein